MYLINADEKIAELRGKLSRYMQMEQTEEVRFKIRAIKGCIAELRDTPRVEDGVTQIVHLAEEVVRCEVCQYGEWSGGVMHCRHPNGKARAGFGEYCSEGAKR